MRLAASLATVALAAALLAGCGGSSPSTTSTGSGAGRPGPASASSAPAGARAKRCGADATDAEQLRVTGVSCGAALQVVFGWQRAGDCALAAGASRGACTVRSYRCASVRAGRGIAVSCSRPERAIGFIVRRR